jgi:hypothetical protein
MQESNAINLGAIPDQPMKIFWVPYQPLKILKFFINPCSYLLFLSCHCHPFHELTGVK